MRGPSVILCLISIVGKPCITQLKKSEYEQMRDRNNLWGFSAWNVITNCNTEVSGHIQSSDYENHANAHS